MRTFLTLTAAAVLLAAASASQAAMLHVEYSSPSEAAIAAAPELAGAVVVDLYLSSETSVISGGLWAELTSGIFHRDQSGFVSGNSRPSEALIGVFPALAYHTWFQLPHVNEFNTLASRFNANFEDTLTARHPDSDIPLADRPEMFGWYTEQGMLPDDWTGPNEMTHIGRLTARPNSTPDGWGFLEIDTQDGGEHNFGFAIPEPASLALLGLGGLLMLRRRAA